MTPNRKEINREQGKLRIKESVLLAQIEADHKEMVTLMDEADPVTWQTLSIIDHIERSCFAACHALLKLRKEMEELA